jgi:hypothetical protein
VIKRNFFQKVFLIVLVIVSINFFEFKILYQNGLLSYTTLFVFIALIISIPYVFFKNSGFVLPVCLISFSILFSIFMAHYSWGQPYLDSIKATTPYLLWFYFFYLLKHKIPIPFIEKTVVGYGILYVCLYFFQFMNSSIPMFGFGDEFDTSRGIVRIVFPGGGLFYLSLFIALNRLTTAKINRSFWIIFVLVGLCVVIMQTTMQYIFAVFVMFAFHFLKNKKGIFKVLTLIVIFSLYLLVLNTDNPLKKGLDAGNKEHTSSGEDYIRILSGTYFLTEFSHNNLSRVLGNGVAYGKATSYGKFVTNDLEEGHYYYLADVGLISVYALFGIFAICGFVLMWIKSFTIPLPLDYYYLKYYLWFLLITCLTSYTIFNYNFLITNVFVLYCYQRIFQSQLSGLTVVKRKDLNRLDNVF